MSDVQIGVGVVRSQPKQNEIPLNYLEPFVIFRNNPLMFLSKVFLTLPGKSQAIDINRFDR